MFRTRVLAGLLLICLSTALHAKHDVSEAALRAHIEFLASDSLKGRDTGSPGHQIAAEYVAAEFSKLGMKPGGENNTFFQAVPLVESNQINDSLTAVIHTPVGDVGLSYPDQYIMGPDSKRATVSVTADLVFVGYGIVAPEFGHDDYAGIDAEGKIVVMLQGRPLHWPTEEGAHLSSGREKRRHAVAAGAIGRIIIQTPRGSTAFPWISNYPYLNVPGMRWVGPDGNPDGYDPQLRGSMYLNKDAAGVLFQDSGHTADELFAADSEGAAVTAFPMKTRATLSRQSSHRYIKSPNVIGIIEGSDPELRDEYLVYTAHLDHIGVIPGKPGEDDIYNGALDNAAGVATLLEAARILSQEQLKRSIMFLVVTAEEKGLLGASYFASNPTVPIDSLVANINLDMPVLLYPFADVVAFGAEHSTLKHYVERAANAAGIELSPDPQPEQALFTRSDHYELVKKGVPAVFLVTGYKSSNPSMDGQAIYQAHVVNGYHKPNDDIHQPIDYQAGALFTQININIGREICNDPKRPRWNDGNFFGKQFGRR